MQSSQSRLRNSLQSGSHASSSSSRTQVFVNPFAGVTGNAHPKFIPQVASVNMDDRFSLKMPKAPEKPLSPYMRFSRKMWESVRQQNPECKMWDIGKIIGQLWRELPEQEKQPFVDEYEREKQEYDRALRAFQNSPAYQNYVQLSKAKAQEKQPPPNAQQLEPRVVIMPVESDDDSQAEQQQLSTRQLATARFQRNHRLIAEIFSSAAVPDTRTVVTSSRMATLRQQVDSLTKHQTKLEGELRQLDERFEGKRRRLEQDAQLFVEQLNKICAAKPQLDEQRMQELQLRAAEQLKLAYAAYLQQQQRRSFQAAEQPISAATTTQLSSSGHAAPPSSSSPASPAAAQLQAHAAQPANSAPAEPQGGLDEDLDEDDELDDEELDEDE